MANRGKRIRTHDDDFNTATTLGGHPVLRSMGLNSKEDFSASSSKRVCKKLHAMPTVSGVGRGRGVSGVGRGRGVDGGGRGRGGRGRGHGRGVNGCGRGRGIAWGSHNDIIVVPRLLRHRMSPSSFVSLVGSLSDKQKEVVRQIGFGSLLDLRISELNGDLAMWLVRSNDPSSLTLTVGQNKSFRINELDVYLALKVPCGPILIEEAKNIDTPEVMMAINNWKRLRKVPESVTAPNTVEMPATILSRGEGPEFIVDFVVYVVSCLLCGHQSRHCNYKILKSLMDPSQVCKLNFCEYAVRGLVKALKAFRNNPKGYFFGPLIVVLLCYLDRVEFEVRKVPRRFPILLGWSDELVRLRRFAEDKAGGFGQGHVSPPLDLGRLYELGLVPQQEFARLIQLELNIPMINNDQPEVAANADEKKKFGERMLLLTKNLSTTITEWSEVMDQAPKLFPDNHFVKYLSDLVVTMKGSDTVENEQGPSSEAIIEETFIDPGLRSLLSQGDKIFNSDEFLKCFDDIDRAMNNKKKKKKKKVRDPTMPSFSLGLGLTEDEYEDADLGVIDTAVKQATHYAFSGGSGLFSTPVSSSRQAAVCSSSRQDNVSFSSRQDTQFYGVIKTKSTAHPKLVSIAQPTPKSTAHPKPLSISQTKPDANEPIFNEDEPLAQRLVQARKGAKLPAVLRSPFCLRYVDLLSSLKPVEKSIVDYAFAEGLDNKEIMYYDGFLPCYRCGISSLGGDNHICSSVLDAWARVLNMREHKRSLNSPKRFFFSSLVCTALREQLQQQDTPHGCFKRFSERVNLELNYSGETSTKDIDMVFFVVSEPGHYYVVCIHFKRKLVQILDSRSLSDGVQFVDNYKFVPESLRDGFAYYMGKKDDPRCMDVGRFSMNVVSMPWKSFENSADSGVSAMRHMETYMGLADRWECGLKKGNDRPLKHLRIKFCSSMLLSETNLLKKEVQGKAVAFAKGACELGI